MFYLQVSGLNICSLCTSSREVWALCERVGAEEAAGFRWIVIRAVTGHFNLSNLSSSPDHPRALPETMRSHDKNKTLLLCYESLHEEYCVYWNNQNGPSSRI